MMETGTYASRTCPAVTAPWMLLVLMRRQVVALTLGITCRLLPSASPSDANVRAGDVMVSVPVPEVISTVQESGAVPLIVPPPAVLVPPVPVRRELVSALPWFWMAECPP